MAEYINGTSTKRKIKMPYREGARVHNTNSTIAVADSTPTDLTFNAQRYNRASIHNTGVNPERLICTKGGVYLIWGNVAWEPDRTGSRVLSIVLNGTTTIASVRDDPEVADFRQTVSAVYELVINDYLTLQANQTSGGSLNIVLAGSYSPEFGMQRIG